MLNGKNILVVGARAGGYGESIATAAVKAGARVFGTTLNPRDPRERAFFQEMGVVLIDEPLRFNASRRKAALDSLERIASLLREQGVTRLEAVIHTVAGGFPRQPAVMKSVADVLRGKQTFSDLATAVKRNVYYVNGGSFEDCVSGLAALTDSESQFLALTYRGDLPYFISPTKKYLERIGMRLARNGKRSLIAALPEAWTQSSQFFAGIEIACLDKYLTSLRGLTAVAEDLSAAFARMEQSLSEVAGLDALVEELQPFLRNEWTAITGDSDVADLSHLVYALYASLRKEGTYPVLRQAAEIISEFVREACGVILMRVFVEGGRYEPGDIRQIHYRELTGLTDIGTAPPRPATPGLPARNREWAHFDKDDVRKTLDMYGENFLFLDRVVMETGELHDGSLGFGSFTVPGPEQNPIMKDHFVGMPLFGGHLQMEAVAQFGTFLILKLLKDPRLVPILTGTEFPDLNTMAPPGEKLTMKGAIYIREKRNITLEAWIENRFARSRGLIRGMVLNQRLVKKMLSAFTPEDEEE
jgi:3-hydroxymyristoyl/3-hydroxydecanoyl-(acyl carrier protein) dehydratase